MKRLLLVGLSAMALVACGNSDNGNATAVAESSAAPGQQSVSSTAAPSIGTVPPVVEAPAAPSPATIPTVDAPVETHKPYSAYPICLDLSSTRVTDAVASLPAYFEGSPWIATEIGDACAPFTWVRADTGGTASSPVHLLFFAGQNYDYLGTATLEPYAFTSVVGQTADTVTVDYRWPVGNDANADPTGGSAVIEYRWNGSQVDMLGTLPPEVTG
nr:LppP/LprE family lipoprotein [Rhodococcus sp. (in: high G+C Gram-positive bacteria)]